MQHTESSIKVFWTKDYGMFRTISGNRQLNSLKIKHIIEDIESGTNVLRFCPIVVRDNGRTLDIIDGQHRFYVAKKIKSNVWYIIAEEMSLHQIAKINSNTEKWKAKDFINCYVQLGNKNYLVLQNLMDEFNVSVTDAISLLSAGGVTREKRARETFEQGKFEVKCEKEARAFLTTASHFSFKNKYSRTFLQAVEKITVGEKVEVEELIQKINANAEELKPQNNYKDYLFNLESIYNKGKQSRKVIY